MSVSTEAPPRKLIGLNGVPALAPVGLNTLFKTTKELEAAGLIQKVNGAWIAEAADAERIAEVAKAARRAKAQ